MRVAVLSDTHLPSRGAVLPGPVMRIIERAEAVIHAGDFSDLDTLMLLRAFGKPVVAVHGNVDQPEIVRELPETTVIDLDGLVLGVIHDAGAEAGRLTRMRSRFPEADGVVFGHSHIPLHQIDADGFFILNPGSATDRRRQPRHSMVEMEITGGTLTGVAFVAVDDPVGPLDMALVRT